MAGPSPSPQPSIKCEDVISAADRALEEKNKEIAISALAIEQSRGINVALSKEVEKKNEELGRIYRNPFVLLGLGLLGGIVLERTTH